MPILSRIGSRYRSRQSKKEGEKGDHRRSWHVGTTYHRHNRSSHKSSHHSSTTGPSPSRRRTWHFPRLSLHDDSAEVKHDNNHDDGRFGAANGARKTFSYAAAHRNHENGIANTQETATRAPSPPDSTDTEAVSTIDPYHQRHHLSKTNNTNKKNDSWIRKIKRKTGRIVHAVEDFLFPRFFHPHHGSHSSHTGGRSQAAAVVRVRGGVLLRGCSTAEEHKAKVLETVQVARALHGERGLRAIGFEYRRVLCPEHAALSSTKRNSSTNSNTNNSEDHADGEPVADEELSFENMDEIESDHEDQSAQAGVQEEILNVPQKTDNKNSSVSGEIPGLLPTDGGEEATTSTNDLVQEEDSVDINADAAKQQHMCHLCSSRLFHIESNTQVENDNRKSFIADGDMYDAIARLCQEYAQGRMEQDYNLKWVVVATPEDDNNDDERNGPYPFQRNKDEPIRALVNAEHPLLAAENPGDIPKERLQHFARRPTLLIATGKGKVRAGIFSRQHLLISGLEASTALPLIHEAQLRELNIVIIDPNVHGDSLGMVTFEKSMAKLFRFWEEKMEINGNGSDNDDENEQEIGADRPFSNRDLYILSHSASGSHLARYLLEKSEYYLPHIRAIAFTDSTHNVQWARQKGNHELVRLLESPVCVYFRCGNADKDANWHLHRAGDEAPRDNFWTHRFGNIRTCWAGTKEHSLTNWFARSHIWEHFDRFLKSD